MDNGLALVRPARSIDFDWVADLMHQTLSPYCDGDHRAYAWRIFESQSVAGFDHVECFSSGQMMLVAEVDRRRAGLVYVVGKKQSTVKIGQLIVLPEYRSGGVGSALLAKAEEYALEQGARQIFCTVASPDTSTLDFFLCNGFRITGTARDHRKRNVDEHMLCKQLVDETSKESVVITVFDPEVHADAVRALILSRMQADFMGVDDAWVSELFELMGRTDCVNCFKAFFVAENGGVVTGVVGAIPRKGNPIKLLPLVAADKVSFEALLAEIQGLMMNYGHKLYVHLVPEAWQMLCLQRHGWTLEGVFPGGYALNSVVQQWGCHLIKGTVVIRPMNVRQPDYLAIMAGDKTLEVCVGYEHVREYRVGDLIQIETTWSSGLVRINDIRVYTSLKKALNAHPWQQLVMGAATKEAALTELRKIYPPAKEKLGVYVLQIEPVTVRRVKG